ncbi:MAG: molybdenum cofactor biosynthesis protein MoaE [Chitinophagaceae bacterium]|nr:molybdenum cofactor biosynthesis protein MoaE [Chitinophagaceae bacterium]
MPATKFKNIFIEGPVTPAFIAEKILAHQDKVNIGAHSIFLGQVRADEINGKTVTAIEYTSYEEMALVKMHAIREETFSKFELTCAHVYHSLGIVKSGEISLFVFTSSPHRRAAIDACSEMVERIKKELPVWGKELFDDESYKWKVNN